MPQVILTVSYRVAIAVRHTRDVVTLDTIPFLHLHIIIPNQVVLPV